MERYQFYPEGSLFYVTFSIVEWLPVFVSESACRIVTESLSFCHREKGLRINAFVVMPTHIHAIVFDETFRADRLSATMTDFRKFTGRRIADYSVKHLPSCFSQTFRDAAGSDRERKVWQTSRHPVVIESESFWETKIGYLHMNPARKGLVRRAADWRFSSAGYWEDRRECDVPISAILF